MYDSFKPRGEKNFSYKYAAALPQRGKLPYCIIEMGLGRDGAEVGPVVDGMYPRGAESVKRSYTSKHPDFH